MNRRSERADAYASFLSVAHAYVRILRMALFRFAHGVPDDEEARRMIGEASEIVVAFNDARAKSGDRWIGRGSRQGRPGV